MDVQGKNSLDIRYKQEKIYQNDELFFWDLKKLKKMLDSVIIFWLLYKSLDLITYMSYGDFHYMQTNIW